MSSLADQRSPLQMIRSMTRLPLEFGTVAGWLNPNRRSHTLASVNNVRFYGNSSGCRLMKLAKLGDRSTLSTKLDGLAPLMVSLLLKPHYQLLEERGQQTFIAKIIECSPSTLYAWIDRNRLENYGRRKGQNP